MTTIADGRARAIAAARRGLQAWDCEPFTALDRARYIDALAGVRAHLRAVIGDDDLAAFLDMVLDAEIQSAAHIEVQADRQH